MSQSAGESAKSKPGELWLPRLRFQIRSAALGGLSGHLEKELGEAVQVSARG